MGMFTEAIRRGLDAGKRAEKARQAIRSALEAASCDVSAVVGTEVALRYVDGTIVVSGAWVDERLACVDMSEVGFPATLRWDDRVERAADVTGFETALLRLLESAPIAAKILRIARTGGE